MLNRIKTLYGTLFPTGRAWNFARGNEQKEEAEFVWVTNETQQEFADGEGTTFGFNYDIYVKKSRRFVDAKLKAISDLIEFSDRILDQALPDNDNFSEFDCNTWERNLGLNNSNLDLATRKTIILNRITKKDIKNYTNTKDYLQTVLRNSGFDVYVHENRVWNGTRHEAVNPIGSYYDAIVYDNFYYDDYGISYDSYVCNYINKAQEKPIVYNDYNQKAYSFIIGGATIGTYADVPQIRETELRHLILQTKSTHLAAFLQINYTV
jgi:hypothetical protein